MMRKILLSCATVLLCSLVASAQVYRIAELNAEQIRRLDREKTVVLIPGGILEEHGPFLPSFTDGYWNERVVAELSKAITAKPGWAALVFPTIPLGNSGANDIGGKFSFPGTYSVRFGTLRAVFMDLASELGEQKFKWVFIVNGHGAPNHNRALDQAAEFFSDTYGGTMVNLTGLLPVIAAWDGKKTVAARKEDGMPMHAGMDETSMMLALRPDLVDSSYKNARAFSGAKMEDLIAIARRPDWPGYFGAPQLATSEQYANGWQLALNEAVNTALKILDGSEYREITRFGDELLKSPPDVALDRASLRHENAILRKQQAWLKRKKPRGP